MSYESLCKSICPDCHKIIDARIFESKGSINIEKNCEEHGLFKDRIWSDSKHYIKHKALEPRVSGKCNNDNCICETHRSECGLLFLEITNRCNLDCPVCFANANNSDDEPTMEELKTLLEYFIDEGTRPNLLLGGGEPTVRDDLPFIIELAKKVGYRRVFLGTNGIRIADEPGYLERLTEAGLNTIYLQFDGLKDDYYHITRNASILEKKWKVIEKARSNKEVKVTLVPTVINGVNLDHVGDIFDFAASNRDVIGAISFQPVSFSGRTEPSNRMKERVTPFDIMATLEKTGRLNVDDFIPNYKILQIVRSILYLTNEPQSSFSQAFDCGSSALYFFNDGIPTPVQEYLDLEKLFGICVDIWERTENGKNRSLKTRMNAGRELIRFGLQQVIRNAQGAKMIKTILKGGEIKDILAGLGNPLFVTILHLQDDYNFQVERNRLCPLWTGIIKEGEVRAYPYCVYNLLHRGDMG